MTVVAPFLRAVHPNEERGPSQHARMAGELVAHLLRTTLGMDRSYVFVRELEGWRIRIESVRDHRAMIRADLGLEP